MTWRIGFGPTISGQPKIATIQILGSTSNPDCISDGCTPAQMAQFDHWEWSVTNAAVLPAGSGKVAFEDPNYRITLTWDDDRDGNADDSFEFEFRP